MQRQFKMYTTMMKSYFIAGLALAAMSCATAPKTVVSVHVEGTQLPESVKLITTDSTYSVALDSTGSAEIALADACQAGYATFQLDYIPVPAYIEPGKSFDLDLKVEGYTLTPTFTGEGAAKNIYLNENVLGRGSLDFKAEEAPFIESLKKLESEMVARLDSQNFEPQFVQQEKRRLHYAVYAALPTYAVYHPYYAQKQDYKPGDAYYQALQEAIVEEPALLGTLEYEDALAAAVETMASKDLEAYDALAFLKSELAYVQANYKDAAVREFLVDHFVMEYVGRYGVDNLKEFADIYNANVTSSDKQAAFKTLCDKWAKIAKGQPAPNFKYLDINGKEVALADLAGKYVYIDVWATWCGPCRGEIPHLQKLEHQYAGKNIHFVSISCDQDKSAWEKMVKEDKLGGIQLHFGGDEEFMDTFMITGIPRFILLDREGKILNANMTRPSNSETAKTFDALEGI